MSWIVPVPLLSLLTAKQLEQMVCGMPEICCDVLKKVVRYREVDEQHALVQWFWQTLEEFSNEERVLFMRFVSGRSRLPANTADISQRFQIMKVDRVSGPSGIFGKCYGAFHYTSEVGFSDFMSDYITRNTP